MSDRFFVEICDAVIYFMRKLCTFVPTKTKAMVWFIIIAVVVLALIGVLAYIFGRKENTSSAPKERMVADDGECCGAHAVCERDSLLTKTTKIEYYDDEELDVLAGITPDDYTESQIKQLEDVFYTLREKDVAGWLRSLQTRNIQLPEELREEALLIVSERRKA